MYLYMSINVALRLMEAPLGSGIHVNNLGLSLDHLILCTVFYDSRPTCVVRELTKRGINADLRSVTCQASHTYVDTHTCMTLTKL